MLYVCVSYNYDDINGNTNGDKLDAFKFRNKFIIHTQRICGECRDSFKRRLDKFMDNVRW